MSQSIPFGPSAAQMGGDAAMFNLLPTAGYTYTIGSSDQLTSGIFNAGFARRLIANAGGTVYIQLRYDSVAEPYTVTAGQIIDGYILLIGGTGTGSSAISITVQI